MRKWFAAAAVLLLIGVGLLAAGLALGGGFPHHPLLEDGFEQNMMSNAVPHAG